MLRVAVLTILGLLFAADCQAQKIHSLCVMPVSQSAVLRKVVENWAHAQGYVTVDCLKDEKAGDAVLGFFFNQADIAPHSIFFQASVGRAGTTTIGWVGLFDAPDFSGGVTVWIQSQRDGRQMGELFVGEMLYYGHGYTLKDGLKKAMRYLHKVRR